MVKRPIARPEQPLCHHLSSVSELTCQRLEGWRLPENIDAAPLGELVGLLHDLGKYSDEFQSKFDETGQPVENAHEIKVNHCLPGAMLLDPLVGKRAYIHAVQAAIKSHHTELGQPDDAAYRVPSLERCLEAFCDDFGVEIVERIRGLIPQSGRTDRYSEAFAARLLLGALVRSDWLDSARVEDPDIDISWPMPDWSAVLATLERYQTELSQQRSGSNAALLNARQRVWESSLTWSDFEVVAAPTGTGKTLAALRYALSRCARGEAQHVVVATPFLALMDDWRAVLERVGLGPYLFEDHSMVRARPDVQDDAERQRYQKTLDIWNRAWEAPVILTTFNQLLESLYESNRVDVRRLPSLYRSVIILDEIQQIPTGLIVHSMKALDWVRRAGSASVLALSATPPPLEEIAAIAKRITEVPCPRVSRVVKRLPKRREFHVVKGLEPLENAEIAQRVAEMLRRRGQAVCVVSNFVEDAQQISLLLKGSGVSVLHLSTALYPLHRQRVLGAARAMLERGEPFVLVATQCIEAGVDIDFPILWRAVAPPASVVQAAGRCNREGRLRCGHVYLFNQLSTSKLGHLGSYYQQGALLVTNRCGTGAISERSIVELQVELVRAAGCGEHLIEELHDATTRLDYLAVSERFRVVATRDQHGVVIGDALPDDAYERILAGDVKEVWRHTDLLVHTYAHRIEQMPELLPVSSRIWLCPRGGPYDELIGLYVRPADGRCENLFIL